MGDAAQIQFDMIPSFLGVPVGDLEDLMPGQIAIAGYFCDNLDQTSGRATLSRKAVDDTPPAREGTRECN